MTGFLHGVRVLEITSAGLSGRPVPQPDYTAPIILTPLYATEEAGFSLAIHLSASEPVIFQKRPGDDAAHFTLDDDLLTLQPQPDQSVGLTLACPLRAIDDGGNITDFAFRVLIIAPTRPAKPGQLDFSDPDQSALQ